MLSINCNSISGTQFTEDNTVNIVHAMSTWIIVQVTVYSLCTDEMVPCRLLYIYNLYY